MGAIRASFPQRSELACDDVAHRFDGGVAAGEQLELEGGLVDEEVEAGDQHPVGSDRRREGRRPGVVDDLEHDRYVGAARHQVGGLGGGGDRRDDHIADDLAAAEAARAAADATEAAYRARLDESRAEALKVAQAAKVSSAKATEERVKAANAEIGAKVEAAEARIRTATEATLGEIESVAAEAAREMVERLAGLSVGSDEAARAVRNAMSDG
jgi:F-type H+-transporting ATPase subunit b